MAIGNTHSTSDFARAEQQPATTMIPPTVLEIIAERPFQGIGPLLFVTADTQVGRYKVLRRGGPMCPADELYVCVTIST